MLNHPITNRWPARQDGHIQLYSFPTPNGIKVSAMLEETGLPYEAHLVSIMKNDQMTPEFLALNPNNKIPALIDPNGPEGKQVELFESGAILIYLAEKSGKMLSSDPIERLQTLQWVMWQMGGAGPMFGQFGFFHKFAGKDMEDKLPFERYRDESIRLLNVLEQHLDGKDYMVGGAYSIADLALWPWIGTLENFYKAADILGMADRPATKAWMARCLDRLASQAARAIPDPKA